MKTPQRLPIFLTASLLIFLSIIVSGVITMGKLSQARAASSFPSEYFAPYQDVTSSTSLQSVVQATGQKYYTLAFIAGNGCNADWAGTIPLNQTSIYLPHLDSDIQYVRAQGGDVIISFGGEAGQELAQTCSSVSSIQAQYQAVINQYSATHLDFDIEGGEQGDATTYDRRNTALAALQAANPGLTISFTLPSATTGLLSDSLGLLNNAVSHGVNFNVVNLMTMDYGSADSNMGQESINAANGLHAELQNIFPSKSSSQLWSMVGITPMIGQNDSQGEIFSLSNAQQVLTFAQQNTIGELAFWEVPRDNGNCAGSTTASPGCSGISQSTYAFTNTFKPFTNGSSSGGTHYEIVNRYSGQVLDISGGSTANGASAIQWPYHGGTNQQWSLTATGDGYDYIQNLNSGKVLDDTGWSTTNGTGMEQWDEGNAQANQEWSLVSTGDGYDYIQNRYSGKVLDDTGWSTTNGTTIEQWDKGNAQANQEWQLIQIS